MSSDRTAEALLVDIGMRVALLRTGRGWTQATFAAAAGVPTSAVGAVERGERAAENLVRLYRLAGALGVPLLDLLPDAALVRLFDAPVSSRPA